MRASRDYALRRFSGDLTGRRLLADADLAIAPGAAARRIPLILVCHPGPDSRNLDSTSASIRSFTACFGFSARGRPPLFLNCAITSAGKTSDAGLALAKSRAVHSGFSSCRSGSNFGLLAIAPVLSLVCLAQADRANVGPSKREDETMQRVIDRAERNVTRFAIVETIVLTNNRRRHVYFPGAGQRNAVFNKIASLLVRIKGDAHDVSVPPKTCGVNGFVEDRNFGEASSDSRASEIAHVISACTESPRAIGTWRIAPLRNMMRTAAPRAAKPGAGHRNADAG